MPHESRKRRSKGAPKAQNAQERDHNEKGSVFTLPAGEALESGLARASGYLENPPEGFKMTEIGPLPEEWQVVRLGEVCGIKMGQSPPGSTYNTNGEGLPFFQGKADFGELHPVPRVWCTLPKKVAESGEILISVRAPVGPTNIAKEKCAIGRGLAAIRPRQLADTKFLLYALRSQEDFWTQKGTGSTFQAITKTDLQQFLIPLPPLAEQRAIAHVLRTVQRAKEATERVIAALKELKKSLMRYLFTYGPVPLDQVDEVPLKETELGLIPEHWQVVRLGEVVRHVTDSINPGEVPHVKYIGLEHVTPGSIRLQRHGHASEVRSSKTMFRVGDVLVGKLRPYLDKAALAEWDGVCSTDILVLRAGHRIASEFLAYLAHTPLFLSYAVSTMTGVNHPRTSWKALSTMVIPLPPRDEQCEIARILRAVDRRIEAEENRKRALEELFKSLLHHLMTGKVRVKDIAATAMEVAV